MLTQLARAAIRVAPALAAVAVISGCVGGQIATVPAPRPAGGAAPIAIPPGARAFDIDSTATRVTVLVYRAGPLARLGHNHAIVSGQEGGVVWLGATPAASGFEIHVPVASFVVDDPEARAAAGPEFPGVVPDDARSGTTANMLRAEVLDAEHYPEIVVRSVSVIGTWQQSVARTLIRLRGVERDIDVPVALTVVGDTFEATGAFQIRQTDFGITPFSVANGAIQVADIVKLNFRIVAAIRPIANKNQKDLP
jgi:polyisoprenoid-binding protein YceI